ncbi:MAG: trigger factor [Candidatus Taylorbacteria bacterium]
MQKTYSNLKITKLPHSEVEIEGEITVLEMQKARREALEHLKREADMPGFRKGHVPENIILEKFGEMHILNDAAEIALQEAYPAIVIDNDISVIGRPAITITKIAKDNPLGFKIKVPIFPEVTLADYKTLAKKEMTKADELAVTDSEIDDVIKGLQENKSMAIKKADVSKEEKVLPEVNEEFIKTFGNFKDITDFKTKIKENLTLEKIARAKEKKRLTLGEKLVGDSKMELPEILIEGEVRKMELQFEDDLKRMNLKMDDYLKHLKKNREELAREWREPAEKRAKLQIILNKIALEEKISASKEEMDKEVAHILEHHKDADKERVGSYVEMMLTNEKVWEFLESQSV